jgi:hypothetical protein
LLHSQRHQSALYHHICSVHDLPNNMTTNNHIKNIAIIGVSDHGAREQVYGY